MNNIAQELDEGHQWEMDVFGKSSSKDDCPGKMRYHSAIANAKSLQTFFKWNPKRPKTRIGLEIYECVQSYLDPSVASDLEFYCAIGTSLDRHFGADGFFLLYDKNVDIDLCVSNRTNLWGEKMLSTRSQSPQ